MCLFGSGPKPPQMPAETQAMREPDGGQVRADTRRRTGDRLRSAAQTVLTSGMGVSGDGTNTAGKVLLGQ